MAFRNSPCLEAHKVRCQWPREVAAGTIGIGRFVAGRNGSAVQSFDINAFMSCFAKSFRTYEATKMREDAGKGQAVVQPEDHKAHRL